MKTATMSKRPATRQSSIHIRTDRAKSDALQIRNVLVPTDFSAASLEAVECVLPLIKKFGADLHLVHVFESDYPLASMAAMPLIVPELEVGRRVRRHLRDVAKQYSVDLLPKNIHALKGRPFQEICELARKIDIDRRKIFISASLSAGSTFSFPFAWVTARRCKSGGNNFAGVE